MTVKNLLVSVPTNAGMFGFWQFLRYMGCGDVIISTILHCITTPCCGYIKHRHYVRFYITTVHIHNRWHMFLGYFCSSKRSRKQAWQNLSYFVAFTLQNVYPQDGDVFITLAIDINIQISDKGFTSMKAGSRLLQVTVHMKTLMLLTTWFRLRSRAERCTKDDTSHHERSAFVCRRCTALSVWILGN